MFLDSGTLHRTTMRCSVSIRLPKMLQADVAMFRVKLWRMGRRWTLPARLRSWCGQTTAWHQAWFSERLQSLGSPIGAVWDVYWDGWSNLSKPGLIASDLAVFSRRQSLRNQRCNALVHCNSLPLTLTTYCRKQLRAVGIATIIDAETLAKTADDVDVCGKNTRPSTEPWGTPAVV